MKNWNRVFVVVLLTLVVQIVGMVAFADDPTVGVCGDPTTVNPVSASFEAAGGDGGFGVPVSWCYWSPTDADPWITITDYHWNWLADGSLSYTVPANDQSGPRDGSIIVNGNEVHTVHQAGACGIDVWSGGPGAAPSVFVSNTACERIVEVTSSWSEVYSEDGSAYEGLVYGPNEALYALDPTRGLIIDVTDLLNPIHDASSGGAPLKPRDAVFNHRGDLIVVDSKASGGGLYVFPNTEISIGDGVTLGLPELVPGSFDLGTLMDVTAAANGDLLVTDFTGSVWQFPFVPASGVYIPPTEVVDSGIGTPTAIARSADGTVFVGDGPLLRQFSFDASWNPTHEVSCANFGAGVTVQDAELSADDTLYVTVTTASGGELWEIPFDTASSDCVPPSGPLATFTRINPTAPLVVGVALPFTGRDGKEVSETTKIDFNIPAEVQAFNFFDSLYEFRALANGCEVTVSAQEFSPIDVQTAIDAEGLGPARVITFWGDNAKALGFDYSATNELCVPGAEDGPPLYEHAINAFYGAFNPQIMICENIGTDDVPSDCRLITFTSYYPLFGFFPDDGRLGGVDPKFSRSFLIDKIPDGVEPVYDGEFCGFESPLVPDGPYPTFQTGSDLPIKFRVAEDCETGPFITRNLIAILSLAKIEDELGNHDFDAIENPDITGGGSSDPYRLVFNNPKNKNKPFALQVKLSEDGVNLEPGLYQIVVTDDTAGTLGDPKIYFPAQVTFFNVKD